MDLRDASASVFGEQVAGYYDPRSRRLRVVSGASTSGRVLNELVLAHELTHALEDQRLGLDQERLSTNDDRALAYLSLVEGSATDVMYDYGARYFSGEELLGGVLGSAFQGTGGLPPFVTAQLVFPYQRGLEFVQRLVQVGGGKPALVDAAHRSHPPVSSEQILHPDKYLRFEAPERVELDAGTVLGGGWRRVVARGHGRVGDRRAAGRGRRGRGGRGGRLGRRSLRAVAAVRRRGLRAAVPGAATRWSSAGAGTRRATSASSRTRCGAGSRGVGAQPDGARSLDGPRWGGGDGALRRRGHARVRAGWRSRGTAGGPMRTLRAEPLQGWSASLLAASGLEADAAETVAGTLVATSLRGVDSHGVARLPIYVERLRRRVERDAAPEGGPARRGRGRRGDGGPGQIAGLFATDLSVELAGSSASAP